MTQALLPLLLKKNTRKVINISSTLGSISTHRWAFAMCRAYQFALINARWIPVTGCTWAAPHVCSSFYSQAGGPDSPTECCSSGAEKNACLVVQACPSCSLVRLQHVPCCMPEGRWCRGSVGLLLLSAGGRADFELFVAAADACRVAICYCYTWGR